MDYTAILELLIKIYIELTCGNNGQILVNGSNYNNDTFQT